MTADESYIVIFTNPLSIYDVDKGRLYKINCRDFGIDDTKYAYAVLGGDGKDGLMISGYIRTCMDMFVPNDLCSVIRKYWNSEMIYLMTWDGKFCKISLNDILNMSKLTTFWNQ